MTRRVVLIVLGGVLLALGALTAIGGGALMALFGSSDTLNSGVQQVSTPTRALVSPVAAIQKSTGVQTVFGTVRLHITATPAGPGCTVYTGAAPGGRTLRSRTSRVTWHRSARYGTGWGACWPSSVHRPR